MNIVYTARELQPFAETLDSSKFKFIGSSIEARQRVEDFPYERLQEGSIIYVSLGTVYTTNVGFFRNCMDAMKQLNDVTVVMSLGPNIEISDLGLIPSNFIIRKFVPQLEVLKKAEVFISHAGNNSLNESLSFVYQWCYVHSKVSKILQPVSLKVRVSLSTLPVKNLALKAS